jgi:hypothetical protein
MLRYEVFDRKNLGTSHLYIPGNTVLPQEAGPNAMLPAVEAWTITFMIVDSAVIAYVKMKTSNVVSQRVM